MCGEDPISMWGGQRAALRLRLSPLKPEEGARKTLPPVRLPFRLDFSRIIDLAFKVGVRHGTSTVNV